MLKLKTFCILLLCFGFLIAILGILGVVFSNTIAFWAHMICITILTQLPLACLAYTVIFWKKYHLKGAIPFFIVIFLFLLQPFFWMGSGSLKISILQSRISGYEHAVNQIKDLYAREIQNGNEFAVNPSWLQHLGHTAIVHPNNYGTLVIEFQKSDIMAETSILFIDDGSLAHWDKIDSAWKNKKTLKNKWLVSYRKNDLDLEKKLKNQLLPYIGQRTCPYSR